MSSNNSNMEITTINFPLIVMASIVESQVFDPITESIVNILLPIIWDVWKYSILHYFTYSRTSKIISF